MKLARESVRDLCNINVFFDWQNVQVAAHYALSHPMLAKIVQDIEDNVRMQDQDEYHTSISVPLNGAQSFPYSDTAIKAASVLLAAAGYKVVHLDTRLHVFWDVNDDYLRGEARKEPDATYISLSVLDELERYRIVSSMYKVATTCHTFYNLFKQSTDKTNTEPAINRYLRQTRPPQHLPLREMLNRLHSMHRPLSIVLEALQWQHLHRGDFRIGQSLRSILEAKRLLADPMHADNPDVGPLALITIDREVLQHLALFYYSLGYEVMYPTLGTRGCVHMALNWGPPIAWGHPTLRTNTVVLRQSVAPGEHQRICHSLAMKLPTETGHPSWTVVGRAVGHAAARAAQ